MTGSRTREHIRSNVVGYVAVFMALSGTAYATHPGGNNTISTGDIIDGEVRSADLNDGGVHPSDIAANSIGSGRLADGGILGTDIANDTVNTVDIAPNAIGGGRVANDSLSGNDIQESTLFNDDSLAANDLAAGSVLSDEIANNAISAFTFGGSAEIADSAVDTSEVATDAVGAAEIAFGAVGATEIGNNLVDRPDPSPTLIPGATGENGSYVVDSSMANCNAGEELIGGYGQWTPDDNAANDFELFIAEVELSHAGEFVIVDGGNDSGADHSLVAVATCLQVGS